ncbi:hypothetical protein FHS55_004381 [Angulomicrobium tetraedrale]|uniref:Competence protein n=1 Tax=Ancylobacter tetraedralis TaxID=217068 RepID=A0A839ZGL8_9HYPH|nr:DUF6035 family protein [Ancylobacter tetraedralis]MBB3773737.1 hypothetical protein [Ancylobacter tetraedralis]
MDEPNGAQSRTVQGNTTVAPLSQAVAVDIPAIEYVLDCDTGDYRDVRQWIGSWRYELLVPQRLDIKERIGTAPRFRCSLCSVPVYLIANQHKRFFFRHDREDGSCPAQTRSPLSRDEILARKYHGLRESEPHRRIKALVARSLTADPAFSEVLVERQWRSSSDPRNGRRPDVQAIGPMGRAAFEVQLSTTFLDVVAARRCFYRQEGALLVWVMGWFDPEYRRLTTDDLLFSNNSNILVVNEETTILSESAGRFHVACHYRRPVREGDELIDCWESTIVAFADLHRDDEGQRCWHFDYEGEAAAIRAAIAQDRLQRENEVAEALREELFRFWISRNPRLLPDDAERARWASLRSGFNGRGIFLPATSDEDSSFIALLNALASAKEGRPVGWNYKKLIEVGHRLAEGHPQHVVAFGHALRHFGSAEAMEAEDSTGKWNRRRAAIRASLERGDRDFIPDITSLPLLMLVIPEVGRKLQTLIAKANAAGRAPSSEKGAVA